MDTGFQLLFDTIESAKDTILAAEKYIWENPEPGYREWKTNAYLKAEYEKLGYKLTEAGDIPGFYTEVDTGRPGPTVAVFGELDSLIIPTHPEADKKTGAVHACGHNCQSAALLGIAIALKAPHALDGMSGKIRLIAVPAEEGIERDFRETLIAKGTIKYVTGKPEFMRRGYLNGVDMAFMVHTTPDEDYKFGCVKGSNGSVRKRCTFIGKSAHAGAAPHLGINALYAATNAMSIANALRETFEEKDRIRFHPIITNGGSAVNAIPDKVVVESYLRGATPDGMKSANEKVNRAFACAAAAMGCELVLDDIHGTYPRYNDPNIQDALKEAAAMVFGEENLKFDDSWSSGCSDLGDVCTVIPACHPVCAGVSGHAHATDFRMKDPYTACVQNAKVQAATLRVLLQNDAAAAKKVIAEKHTVFDSFEEYCKAVDNTKLNINAVTYEDDGTVNIKYKN